MFASRQTITRQQVPDIAENRTFSYQQIHAAISSKLKEATNYEFLSTDNWRPKASPERRATNFPFTSVENALQIHPFYAKQTQFPECPNKRKLICYKELWKFTTPQAPAKQSQFKPNSKPIKPNFRPSAPKTNPIQSQSNPIKATDFKGQLTIYEYDERGRLEYESYYVNDANYDSNYPTCNATPEIYYEYDSLGRKGVVTVTKYDSNGAELSSESWDYDYDTEGQIISVTTPQGTVNYEYDPTTGQKARTYTTNTDTDYFYDELGRLETVHLVERNDQTISEQYDYTYNEVGSRRSLTYDNGNYTYYVYDAINRLTSLTNFEEFEETPESPTGNTLSKFEYKLYADGMRSKATEKILPQGGTPGDTPLKDQVVTYSYDNLNRLTMEVGDDDPLDTSYGYTAEYEYDLVGNRLSRAVYFEHRADELLTEYEYNDKDQLIRQTHTDDVPWVAIQRKDGPYYAYANSNGIFYTRANSKVKIGPFKAWFIGLPSAISQWLFGLAVAMLVVAFFIPAIANILRKVHGREPARMPLSMTHRCLSVLIAYVMLISPMGFEQLARASTQYSDLGVSSWGEADRIIEYGSWDGTGRTGNFTLGYDNNGSVMKKITWDNNGTPEIGSDDTKIEEVSYEYNLQNRLARVTTVDYISITTTVIAYKYNDEGIRVQKIDDPDGAAVTTTYLIDAYNHTGYAQVLEESGASLKTYTIGDDMLTEAVDSGTAKHLLYDGHGSARQLVSGTLESMTIHDDFSYDGYGVLLQQESVASAAPGKVAQQATNLLYAGEQFDTSLQMYYNRARYYDQNIGRFNRIDPFSGNNHDPQSLHKYLYAHCNPINGIDPSGHFTILQLSIVIAIVVAIPASILTIRWFSSEARARKKLKGKPILEVAEGLKGKLYWKNPPYNEFYEVFYNNKGNPWEINKMNCWEFVLYCGWINGMYNRNDVKQKDARHWSSIMNNLKTYSKKSQPSAGDLVFFYAKGYKDPVHVAISVGGTDVWSLWCFPSYQVSKTTFAELKKYAKPYMEITRIEYGTY